VRSDEASHEGDFVLIGNGKFYAGKYPFLHQADLADGKMDVTIFPEFNWISLPWNMTKFAVGKYFRHSSQPYFQAAEIELSAAEITPLQLDGELVGHLPAKIKILPKALRVLVP
jgi:diacylglycerol kinase family enzyme